MLAKERGMNITVKYGLLSEEYLEETQGFRVFDLKFMPSLCQINMGCTGVI